MIAAITTHYNSIDEHFQLLQDLQAIAEEREVTREELIQDILTKASQESMTKEAVANFFPNLKT